MVRASEVCVNSMDMSAYSVQALDTVEGGSKGTFFVDV